VVFSGRETIFKGVKKLVAYGDGGDDHIYVKDGVTSDVEFHGGDGNDVFIYDGTGQATLYGDAGDDYMATGDASTTAFLYGGDGMDYIIHNGKGRARSTAVKAATRSMAARRPT
jgi:Ca2+-binding RTX toxin-like protein